LCQVKKCDVHNRVTRCQPTPQELAHRKKEALAKRVKTVARPHPRSHPQEAAGCGLAARLGDGRPSGVWAMSTTAVFPSSSRGNRRKSKPSWGAQTESSS